MTKESIMNFEVDPGTVLSLITIVAGITIYTFIKSRHIERMHQLELGDPLDRFQNNYLEVKFGLLFIGIGTGYLTAFIFNKIWLANTFELYPAFIFLFGGIGLFISFFLVEWYKRKQ